MSGATDVAHEAQSSATVARLKADAAYQLAQVAIERSNEISLRLRAVESDERMSTFWGRLRWLVRGS